MERESRGSVGKRLIVAGSVLGCLTLVAAAQADVVQEVNVQIKNVKPDGRYTILFSSRTYDTSGGVPPSITSATLRFPLGAALRRRVLRPPYLCDPKKLNQSKNPSTCEKAQVGTGTAQVDARPLIPDIIPAHIWLFLGRGTVKGAVASLVVLGAADPDAAVTKTYPIVRDTKPVLTADFFNDPTPDGLYGYRLQLPVGPIGGVRISVASVDTANPGITIKRKIRVCARSSGAGASNCKRKRIKIKRIFWVTEPKCPPSGKLSFRADYTFEGAAPITKLIELPCLGFKR